MININDSKETDLRLRVTQENLSKALRRYLKTAGINELWVKLGHGEFYPSTLTDNDLLVRSTRINYDLGLEGEERSLTRSWSTTVINNGYEFLFNLSHEKEGGVFFGCSDGTANYPLKSHQLTSTQVVTEIDDLPHDEQLEKYRWFGEVSGLKPYLISSGGKSVHGHLLLNKQTPIDKVVYLRRLLCLIVDGDPAVTRPHQPFRLPTFYRKEKGTYQAILQGGDNYSYERILEGIKACFDELGYIFPNEIDDRYWTHLTSILNSDKGNKGRKKEAVTKEEKLKVLKEALATGQDGFYESLKKTQKERIATAKIYQVNQVNLSNSDKEKLILELLQYIPPKTIGDGLYEDYRGIFTAVANELGVEKAIQIAEAHSPAKTKWRQVLTSSHGNFSLGTIYHYAKTWGGYSSSNSEYGKVILSGKEALDRAKSSVTLEDLKEHSVMSADEFRKALDDKEYSEFQEAVIREYNHLSKKFEKGFSNRIIDIPNLNFTEITFNPETFFKLQKSDLQDEVKIIIPQKYCNPVLRAKIITHLRQIGVKYCFDRTQTGGGKSTTVSLLDKILYLDSNYKNPSNPQLQETPYLSPRTEHGLYMVNGEFKADPSKEIRELADSENHPNIFQLKEGNCHLKPVFLALQNNGYGNADNLPCQKCDRKTTCSLTPNYYKHEVKNDIANMLKAGQGRMHPSQLTTQKLITTFIDWGNIWEEVGTLSTTNELAFTPGNIDDLIVKLKLADTLPLDKINSLIEVLNHLRLILNPEYAKSSLSDDETGHKFYGLNNNQITSKLPEVPEFTPDEYLELLRIVDPLNTLTDINDIDVKVETRTHLVSKEYLNNQKANAEKAKNKKKEELLNQAFDIPPNAVKLFEALLAPSNKITLSTQQNDFGLWILGVSYFNDTWSLLAKQAKFNLFMDATISTTQLKSMFELDDDSEPLVIIQNEIVELDNLNVFNVDIQGFGSNDWSQESIDRAKEAVRLIRSQNPNMNIAVMTLKRYADELETQYWYGKHDRGTNKLKDYDAIIFVGTPFINVGAVKREYEILFSGKENSPTFEQFYNQKIYELRMQGMGRSRAQYKSKPVHQFYLTTGEDLSYLKELGVNYKEVSGTDISPSLGTKRDRTLFKIKNVVLSLIKSGIKVTCQAVADNLELTKQAISKAVKSLGLSWRDFIFCQLRLLESYIGKVDKNEVEKHWTETYLKDEKKELITMAISTLEKNGIDGFFELLEVLGMPYNLASRLLWILSPLFDERLSNIPLITESH